MFLKIHVFIKNFRSFFALFPNKNALPAGKGVFVIPRKKKARIS